VDVNKKYIFMVFPIKYLKKTNAFGYATGFHACLPLHMYITLYHYDEWIRLLD